MSALFTPLNLGPLSLDNRIVIAPMCQYSATDGLASAWHRQHIGALACSGAGLLLMEATAVTPIGRITPACLGLWNDAQASALQQLLKEVSEYSAMPIGIQLAHAGRKGSHTPPWQGGALLSAAEGGWHTVAPSALPYAESQTPPHALTVAEIHRLIDAFAAAAVRAKACGFKLIELHAAHGYLLHQFLSPLANHRSDAYGATLSGRCRLVLEVLAATRAAVGNEIAVGLRVSASDWVNGGWDLAMTTQLARECEQQGADFIHISSGGLSPQQVIAAKPLFQVPLARHIKQHVKMPVIAVGMITTPQQAESVLVEHAADAVALARAFLLNPHWPYQAAIELGGQVTAPKQFWRSAPAGYPDLYKTA
jgi:2,4-dienoyl-CoA reductase-like NADH-dependent reductase (Old Yellow Enzyme family)